MAIRIIEPSYELVTPREEIQDFPRRIERMARICYQSEGMIKEGSADRLIRKLLNTKPVPHESVLEHCSISIIVEVDRSTSHQIVRHRLCAFSQESQRYCDYAGKQGQEGLKVICPPSVVEQGGRTLDMWKWDAGEAYSAYRDLRTAGVPPEDARSVLPNATATRIGWTANVREWRHIFRLRCDKHAQWQFRGLMLGLLRELYDLAPVLFEDLAADYIGGD